jgi:hypothetical protein
MTVLLQRVQGSRESEWAHSSAGWKRRNPPVTGSKRAERGSLGVLVLSSVSSPGNKQPPMQSSEVVSCGQMVCKPGSVEQLSPFGRSFLYEHGRPCSLAAYPRCLDRGGRLSPHIWPCSNWGLPCRSCCHERGGLLLHRFTLTIPENGGLFSVALIRHGQLAPTVPRSYLAAYPLEPGLSSNRYQLDTNARSPDHLPLQI